MSSSGQVFTVQLPKENKIDHRTLEARAIGFKIGTVLKETITEEKESKLYAALGQALTDKQLEQRIIEGFKERTGISNVEFLACFKELMKIC